MARAAPRFLAGTCARAASPRSPCDACVRACARGALSLGGEGVIVRGDCDGCGACESACPGGALALPANDGMARPDHLPQNAPVVVAACVRAGGGTPDVLLPCLAAMPAHLAAAVALRDCGCLELRSGDCKTCDRAPAAREIPTAMDRARAWLGVTGRQIEVRRVEIPGGRSEGQVMTRRGLFAMLGKRWLPAGPGQDNRIPGPRGDLLDALAAGGTPPALTDPSATFHDLRIGPACIGCTVCREVCPAGAIRREEVAGGVEIHFNPCLCTGCGNCVTCCLPRAAMLVPLPAHELARRAGGFPDSHRGLSQWEPRAMLHWRSCPACGAPVLGGPDAPCLACRSRRFFSA